MKFTRKSYGRLLRADGTQVDGAGRILVSQDHGEGAFPLIHVFEV